MFAKKNKTKDEIAFEINSYDIDGYPRDEYVYPASRNPLNLYRLMKRAASAVKRERIIMDAMGGDYLVRKRSVYY
uniref:Uncharacterized protein n=1 Tax=Panagrolaimus sp. PS1159 TaxID=55785 RepID=A0AC35GV07_9BILA